MVSHCSKIEDVCPPIIVLIHINYYCFCSLQFPTCEDEWLEIAGKFESRWNLPHCIGAIDGTHINIVKPTNSGSMYFNYKGFFSIVLLAVVDADCNFIYVEVGAQGRMSDGGIYGNSHLSKGLENKTLHVPGECPLAGTTEAVPYFIVGDDTFPLRTYLIEPYSKRALTEEEEVTNYRFSRVRRT